MPHSYDFFVAAMTCPICGRVSPADTSTNMQTYLRDAPDMASLTVGDALTIDPERIRRQDYEGYLTVNVPEPGEPVRMLLTWECPSCGSPLNWAEVTVRDGTIESIQAVRIDRERFERSHLLSNDSISLAAEVSGQPVRELVGTDIVRLLRETL